MRSSGWCNDQQDLVFEYACHFLADSLASKLSIGQYQVSKYWFFVKRDGGFSTIIKRAEDFAYRDQ